MDDYKVNFGVVFVISQRLTYINFTAIVSVDNKDFDIWALSTKFYRHFHGRNFDRILSTIFLLVVRYN